MATVIGSGCWFLFEISSDKGEIKYWGLILNGNESWNLLVAKASKIVGNKNLKIPKPDAYKQWNGLCFGLKEVLELLGFKGKTNKESTTLEVLLSETQFEIPKATSHNGNNADTTQTSQQTEENSKNIWESLDQMVLVVASLIDTVTYQTGLSPPQTIWKEDMKNHPKCIFHRTNPSHSCPDITYYLFMSFNTSGFFAACFLIFFYRKGSYVRVLLPVALVSMMITYITLSVSMSPNVLSLLILYLVITLAIFLYCILAIEMVKKVIHKMFSYAHDRASNLATLAYERYKLAGSSGERP